MAEQGSPWARPDTEIVVVPVGAPARVSAPEQRERVSAAAPGYRAGNVNRLHEPPPPDVISGGSGDGDDDDPVRRNRRMLRLFLGGAAAVVVIALVVVAGMVMTGHRPGGGIFNRPAKGPSDTRPELAKRCPPPSIPPDQENHAAPPPPAGPRTVDEEAGISYKQYGEPWEPWDAAWNDRGELRVTYRTGQHFVTEPLYDGLNDYHATILSGHVPAAVNDGLFLDLKCIGHQIAADVRISFYPKQNTVEPMRDEGVTLGGRPAWIIKFRLHFNEPPLKAKSELVSIALIDVGRPEAAILYVSIPDTHRQFDPIADEALESVRPI